MNSLPKYVLFEIFSFLSEKDLVKGPLQVCNDFRQIIKGSEYLLSKIAKSSLGLVSDFRVDHALFQQLFNKIHSSPPVDLSFKGFATTGGFYEDDMTYWVGNLYKGDSTYYCSRPKININTAGVLEATLSLELEEENCEYITKILSDIEISSSGLYSVFKYQNSLGFGLKRSFVNVFTFFRNEIIQVVSQRFNEPPELVVTKLMKEINGIYSESIDPVKIRKRLEDVYVLQDTTDTAMADRSKTKAVITEIHVSRIGAIDCALQTFIVLCSEKYIDIESEEFAQYNDVLKYEILRDTFPGQISELNETEDYIYCNFTNSNQHLKPLAWGKFIGQKKGLMKIHLSKETVGNYLYLKMIKSNCQEEMQDHNEFANIDCNYVIAKGHIVKFN